MRGKKQKIFTIKRLVSGLCATALMLGIITTAGAVELNADEVSDGANISFDTTKALYVHGVINSSDTEAWQIWQNEHNPTMKSTVNPEIKYFFLPTSADNNKVDIYNAFDYSVVVNDTEIPAGKTAQVSYEIGKDYSVDANGGTYTLRFMKSNAEAGIYINNSNADDMGTDLMTYLNKDKSRTATATGAIVEPDGSVDNTPIKKIKGRGNTTWGKPKKAYNITYSDSVSVAGMSKSKKYSILANYQDDSLSRNRFLYDLSDAVGMPYASDSRYVDFYVNGYYWGSYQLCEKVEVGKNNLIKDIDDKAYINEDGTINKDFPFVCEIDAGAVNGEDYYVTCNNGTKVTIKSPELEEGDTGYNEVKAYVRTKFNLFYDVIGKSKGEVSKYADVDSVAKLYLINELGKNWDSGVSSTYFTWKQDSDGNYKFFGSPVWDYDNSLGNAVGVKQDLEDFEVTDYQQYTGWWCKYKDNYGYNSTNLISRAAVNDEVQTAAARLWFDKFIPALNDFYGKTDNGLMKSYDEYYSLISDSAEMNYQSGWLLKTSNSWIADHSKLETAEYDSEAHNMITTGEKSYSEDFSGMYSYAVDWMYGRAAWLSEQFYLLQNKVEYPLGDANLDGVLSIDDATEIQKFCAGICVFDDEQFLYANANGDYYINIDDCTFVQKLLAGISTEDQTVYPDNLSAKLVKTLKNSLWGLTDVIINFNTENPDEIGNKIAEEHYMFYNPVTKTISAYLTKSEIIDIATEYGSEVYLTSTEEVSGIADEKLLEDMQNAEDSDRFLIKANFYEFDNDLGGYYLAIDEFLNRYFESAIYYNADNGDGTLVIYATKAQLENIQNDNCDEYFVEYYNPDNQQWGFQDDDDLDTVSAARPKKNFYTILKLCDLDLETLSCDAQLGRIINEYFNGTSTYDYSDGYIFIVAKAEALLKLHNSGEHVKILYADPM